MNEFIVGTVVSLKEDLEIPLRDCSLILEPGTFGIVVQVSIFMDCYVKFRISESACIVKLVSETILKVEPHTVWK